MAEDGYDYGIVGLDDFGSVGVGEASPSIAYVAEDGVSSTMAEQAVRHADVASAIETWMRSVEAQSKSGRRFSNDIFDRKGYVSNGGMFETMAACASAVENDDVLSTLADTVEGMAFQKMRFEMHDNDQEDVWNQIAADIDLDSRLKEMWRELFKVSQVYVGIWWERRTYTVQTRAIDLEPVDEIVAPPDIDPETGKPQPKPEPKPKQGNRKRKKQYDLIVPTDLTIFDPTKIVPVGQLMFGRERFAYIADRGETDSIQRALDGEFIDETVLRLIERKYTPDYGEESKLSDAGIPTDRLWLLKREAVFRHTLTRSQYERWAVPRLKSILEVLDMKTHLRQADRASLIGATNFIVLIRKGSDKIPARPAEIKNLQEQSRVVARLPILVGDHRLQVDIVTPPTDNTLKDDRHNLLDARLVFRALQSFAPNAIRSTSSGSGAVSELSRVVAMGMESRRHQLKRSLERHLFAMTVARNPSDLDESPTLVFSPKRIALDFNQVIANTVLQLRDRGDISRETALSEFDFDQDVEALRRLEEHKTYDKVFQTQVPFSSPNSNPYTEGQKGGRPEGTGGTTPQKQSDKPTSTKNREKPNA